MFNEVSFREVLLALYPMTGEVSIKTYLKSINFCED